ncbi:hypothetical protein [Methylobacter sp.]|uniref:hypothetical protein n=1 Tax=Methylobacter sp. TaxID=2051955 RepID=UPI0012276FE7|nr:hypothetical protein [Methylobacter sp.]TAK61705.1 MAG: hypothetical protein EPO18_12955 [Methylobacter sp.]
MRKISILGVVIGSVADIALSGVLGMAILSSAVPATNVSPEVYQQLTEQAMLNDLRLFFYVFLSGSACSILGGYIAAKIAKRAELLNGALASFLCVSFGIESLVSGGSSFPLWLELLSVILSPALATLGGYLCLNFKRVPENA